MEKILETMMSNAINFAEYEINLYGPNDQRIKEITYGMYDSIVRYQQVAEFAENMGWDTDLIDGSTGEVLAHF